MAEFYSENASPGVVIAVTKRCTHQDCMTRPSYGVGDGSKKSEIYSQHAEAGMVNVGDKRCVQQDCIKWPSYRLVRTMAVRMANSA